MPARWRFTSLGLCTLWLCLFSWSARADKLQISSTPPGATVEIDGVPVGTTPLEKDFPGGYFHRTRTSMGSRLEHPLVARVSLEGYATREIALTEGPMNWVALNGRNHGEYWLLKAKIFHIDLDPIAQTFTGAVTAKGSGAFSVELEPELSLEELVKRAKPAVVYLKGFQKAGTGFFVTDTGVIATNAHVARGEGTLLTILPSGQQLEARVVYIDADLDIALAKVTGENFPHLPLADATTLRQGENVLAIGNPGDAMLFSVTKGIISAVGKFANAGPGTWVQTDTPINPGNSGGPLLNSHGQVIGINTQKLIKKNVTGIGFALSSTDLLGVLHKFYPSIALTPKAGEVVSSTGADAPTTHKDDRDGNTGEQAATSANESAVHLAARPATGFGVLAVTSDPDGADIYVDEKFVGNSPARLKLAVGTHAIVLKAAKHTDWQRTLEVYKDSSVTLRAALETQP